MIIFSRHFGYDPGYGGSSQPPRLPRLVGPFVDEGGVDLPCRT